MCEVKLCGCCLVLCFCKFFSKGRFTHETKSPWPPLHFQSTLVVGNGGGGPSSLLPATLRGTNGVSVWMQDGCQVYMDSSCMASNGSCFMVTWTIFKNHLLEVGLTHNWETMALWMLTTVNLFYFIKEVCWNNIWLRARSHMASHYTWGFVITVHDFGGVMGQPLDTFFWALTISRSRLLARVWSGPNSHRLPLPQGFVMH